MSRVAIIGTGISGMVAARMLHRSCDITVFEAGSRPGGHTNTIPVSLSSAGQTQTYPVDTGFIVFNNRTYPNFSALLDTLGIASRATTMSFSVRDDQQNLEYMGGHWSGLFAQRRNIIRPAFWRMIREIMRFYREARSLLADDCADGDQALGPWLSRHGYSRFFVEEHLVPMAASIWSAPAKAIVAFPARFFIRFLANHGMIDLRDRPQWRTVVGGSQRYLEALIAPFAGRIRCSTPISAVRPCAQGVRVSGAHGEETFDQVVIAAHADQALAMRPDATAAERDILSAFPYQPNQATLHTDQCLLPRRRTAWAAWNYHRPAGSAAQPVTLTYNLNILQGHTARQQLLVSLNATGVRPQHLIRRIPYAHPLYQLRAPAAQARWADISGRNGIHYCGAYWGYGFHEDGVVSALRVGRAFGVEALT